jgi:2-amino-4-hydroxy-6-hydroxymethyldihydropteridine diphosphokinase
VSPAIADAYVAAGSNVRPRESLRRAVATLAREFPGLTVSRAWSNAAVGFDGDDFINLVVKFPSDLSIGSLLERLKAIERTQGREPGAPKWGPRTLDLDLLLYGDLAGRYAGATLPHPDIAMRAWVLGPLPNSSGNGGERQRSAGVLHASSRPTVNSRRPPKRIRSRDA